MPYHFIEHSVFNFIDGCPIQPITLSPNVYLFEGWGASGGGTVSGNGGYTSGVLKLNESRTFYIIVGGQGADATNLQKRAEGGCNGGGSGGYGGRNNGGYCMSGTGGGGATDVRLMNDKNALDERILVAAGGGGSSDRVGNRGGKGHAGGLIGSNSTGYHLISSGAGQDYGYAKGKGQNGRNGQDFKINGGEGNGGGGGGLYGGYSIQKYGEETNAGGGGGSSYISGYPDCLQHHLFVFTNPIMKSGSDSAYGRYGNGLFRISVLYYIPLYCSIRIPRMNIFLYLGLFVK